MIWKCCQLGSRYIVSLLAPRIFCYAIIKYILLNTMTNDRLVCQFVLGTYNSSILNWQYHCSLMSQGDFCLNCEFLLNSGIMYCMPGIHPRPPDIRMFLKTYWILEFLTWYIEKMLACFYFSPEPSNEPVRQPFIVIGQLIEVARS